MAEEESSQILMCRTTTGMGNVIGNATMVVRNFIKELFPKNFFQDEFIDTQMVQTEMDGETFTKKNKPCLVIRPKLSLDDDTLFGKLPDWCNTNYFVYKKLRGNYLPVIYDDVNQIYVYSTGDRIKLNFEIEILVDTKLQQINTAYYLKGSVLHKSQFYLNNTRLETEIPKYYMKQIATVLQMDLTNKDIRLAFNNYLNEKSQHFITEKIKLSSGNLSHFYLFSSNILCLFENNPEIDDGENQGMTTNNFKISETLTTEFWCPMTFFLEIGKNFRTLDTSPLNFIDDTENKLTFNYTVKFPLPEKYNNMWYYTKIMYITDDDPKQDVVDISELFNSHDIQVINFAKEHLVSIDDIFHIDLYFDKNIVEEPSVIIDWTKLELTNINPKTNNCYTLVVYKSTDQYNKIEQRIDNLSGNIYNK